MARTTQNEFNQRIQQLVVLLREQIYSGDILPDDYLPSELSLGKQFQLSKESVRRALDELVDEGLITKIRRVGNRVNDPSKWLNKESSLELEELTKSIQSFNGDFGNAVLRFAYHPSLLQEAVLQQLADSFEQAHPGIHVQMMPTAFPIEYADRGLADVVSVTAWDTMKRMIPGDDLEHLISPPYTDAVHPKLYEPFLYPDSSAAGRLLSMPFLFSPLVLCYNRGHFIECGLQFPDSTWTWYTLLNAARHLTSQLNVWGFATHIHSINRWPIFLMQNDFHFQAEQPAQRTIDNPALWEGLRIARDLVHKQGRSFSLWTEDNSDAEQLFLQGNASAIITTYYGINRLRDSELDYALAPLPALANADTLLLTTGLSIQRDSPHKELAQHFVQYLGSLEAQSYIRKQTLSLPVHSKALATTSGLTGNRPKNENVYDSLWSKCRQYSDLGLDAKMMEAFRLELKAYWSRMEDEIGVRARLESLLQESLTR